MTAPKLIKPEYYTKQEIDSCLNKIYFHLVIMMVIIGFLMWRLFS